MGFSGMQKAIVALIISALQVLELATGWQSGITESYLLMLLAVLNPLLVWVIPNR